MKERPILMTPENAQKVFDGTKAQTRRIVKRTDTGWVKAIGSPKNWHLDDHDAIQACPFGQPGDRLWIREAWSPCDECSMGMYKGQGVMNCPCCDASTAGLKFTPSIHMPRWACRTVVRLTDVRVERLQEISEEDAISEGVALLEGSYNPDDYTGIWKNYSLHETAEYWNSPRDSYRSLWESINGHGSWERNDWVWVLTIKLVKEVGK